MAEVKAQFPIGKTQWAKWTDEQRKAFNILCARGRSISGAVEYINGPDFGPGDDDEPELKPVPKKKKHGFLGALEDTLEGLKKVEDVVETVADVAAAVTPVVAVAKTVVKATKKKGK
jgi:hypothetical protein